MMIRRKFRRPLLLAAAAIAVCLAGSLLQARPGVLKTKEGQVYDGDIVDVPANDYVTVTVRGIATEVQRADIDKVTYNEGIDKEYHERLAKLDKDDSKGRLALARWAFDQHRYDLAEDAANKALQVNPNNAEAAQFFTLIQYQRRLERNKAREATQPAEAATTPATTAATIDRRFLSPDDINRIRQEELRKNDTRVRVIFKNDVEKKFLSTHHDITLTDWRAMAPALRAIAILDMGDPSWRDDVVIASDPIAIMDYRRVVQPIVLSTCATTACHGGASGGNLVLYNNAETNEPATYTNFYILQQYVKKVQTPTGENTLFGGTVERRMIDRARPDDSLLIQYGLPRNVAKFPHPDVQGYHFSYRTREDPRYRAVVNWIGTTLAPVQPNYGIDYEPPAGSTTGPSTNAATAPTTRPVRRR